MGWSGGMLADQSDADDETAASGASTVQMWEELSVSDREVHLQRLKLAGGGRRSCLEV